MIRDLFTEEEIKNAVGELSKTIFNNTCSLKIENRSPYALDIFLSEELIDRVNPYSFIVMNNDNYTVKLNKNIKSENEEGATYIYWKGLNEKVQEMTGSTTFTGTINATITNSEINTTITNSELIVNVSNSELNTNITNAVLPITAPNGIDVNIQNATVPISGEVSISSGVIEANIQNAKIDTELVNAKIGTNNLIKLVNKSLIYNDTPPQEHMMSHHFSFETGIYNNFVVKISAVNAKTNQPLEVLEYDYENTYSSFNIFPQLDVLRTKATIQSEDISSLEPQTSKGGVSLIMGLFEFDKEIPVNNLNVNWAMRGTIPNDYIIDGVKVNIEVYGYNSNFYRKFKGVEVETLKISKVSQFMSSKPAFDLNNGDIIGANGIYLNDPANVDGEGICFPKTGTPNKSTNASDYETLRVLDGVLYLNSAPLNKVDIQYLSAGQNIPDSVYTKINNISYTAKKDGQIEVYAQGGFTGLAATATSPKTIYLRVAKNGVWGNVENYITYDNAQTSSRIINGRKTINVKKGDVLTIYAYAVSGSYLSGNWTFAEFKEL